MLATADLLTVFQAHLRTCINLLPAKDPDRCLADVRAAFAVRYGPPSIASGVAQPTEWLMFEVVGETAAGYRFERPTEVSPLAPNGRSTPVGTFLWSPGSVVSAVQVAIGLNEAYGILASRKTKKLDRVVEETIELFRRNDMSLYNGIVDNWSIEDYISRGYVVVPWVWPRLGIPGTMPLSD